jgi:tetratricopeptide (TPR) repeat protein
MKKALVSRQQSQRFSGRLNLASFILVGSSLLMTPLAAQEIGQALPTGTLSKDSQTPGIIHAELQEKQGGGIILEIPSHPVVDIYRLPNRIVNWPALRANDSTPDSQFSEGLSQLAKNNYAAAQQAFRKVLDDTQDSEKNYRLGERFAAVELFTLATEAFKKSTANPKLKELAQEWRRYYLPTRFLNANQEERFLLAIYGRPPRDIWQSGNRKAQAAWRREQLKELIDEMPDFAPAHRWLGLWSESPKSGLSELQKAVFLSPGHMQSLETLGDNYARSHQYEQAARAYEQALQSIENKKFAQDKPWKETLRGKHKLALGNGKLMQNPKNTTGWQQAGNGLLQQERPDEARNAFRHIK